MPYSLYEKLGIGELSPTRMSLSLADRFVKYPRGIIENLLVKVDKFVFPVDFVVLDMEADEKVPILLGCPFLCTAKAIIDVFDGKITLQVVESRIDEVVEKVEEVVSESEEVDEDEWVPEVLELSEIKSESESTPMEKPAPLELKVLSSHLEYAFLGEGSEFPVIISSKLEEGEKGRLLEVLRVNREAIAWRLSDIKGISPAYCTHRILMEDDYKPVVQPQRHLNPNMQEVVKKEVLKLMLKRCIETNLMLNWEKCHFMVTEGIVLGHKVSREGIEVDRAKIDTISTLPPPTSVKSVRSFLGHAGFYRRFIKDFSKITRPMTRLLEKDVPFVFDEECIKAFDFLKEKLASAPILVSPDWSLPFELMCDASDYAVGAVLGQRVDKHFHPIYYASKTLNDAQENYTTTEKELLAVVFAFDKFRSYLVLSKTTVFTDHSALRFLFQKKDAKSRLIRWILLLFEFDIEIKDKKGAENVAADHLSRLEDPKREEVREDSIGDTFPHETIDFVSAEAEGLPWFSDLANYLATGDLVRGMSYQQKKKLLREARKYIWDDPYLFRIGGDRVLRRCVSKEDGLDILRHVHEGLTGGHHGANVTAQKVFDKLEHRALWALKTVNLNLTETARRRFFQIHELEALRDAAYERSWSIKEKTKALHDRRLRGLKEFKVGDKVLLFNSRLKLIAGKLKSRWNGPYVVKEVFPYGTVELYDEVDKGVWKVNGHRLKHYLGGPIDTTEEEEIPLEDPPTFTDQFHHRYGTEKA
ncbi:uncharacterized protein LOC110944728 [Helianthus annuus]|uniref:uncharacterized protein LOC110944728 n=1 Tax=Helianthus annuus TaxID=4232 RepID=UPI001652BA82|nr:uncharacterized protein LOC110944728 [Helianthus annuus]